MLYYNQKEKGAPTMYDDYWAYNTVSDEPEDWPDDLWDD